METPVGNSQEAFKRAVESLFIMTELQNTAELIESGRLDELEDLWLDHLADQPQNLDFFVGTAELLAGSDRDRTTFLLDLVDEQLREGTHWQDRLELLRRVGPLYLEPSEIHAAIMGSLREMYRNCPSLEGLIEKVGLLRAIADTSKTWDKVRRLQGLMQFERGTVVWMEGKGPGRVEEVNLELESFKLELEQYSGLRVGFAAAPKLLRPLPPHHIERRKLEDPETLQDLKRAAPGELLLTTLKSYDQPMTAAEIRQLLGGLVADHEWSSWWSQARQHPQVLTATAKGHQAYTWASSESDALETVRQQFATGDIADKLKIFRKNASRSTEVAEDMAGQLRSLALESLAADPGIALTIWYALDKAGALGELSWTPGKLLQESADPAKLIASVGDRAIRERLYHLGLEEHPDPAAVARTAFSLENDPRLLTTLAEWLGEQDPSALRSAVDDLLSHPRRRPATFTWLAENVDSPDLVAGRSSLRMLQQILDCLHQSEFATFKVRLQRTVETGGPATKLLAEITEAQAPRAEQALQRAPLEEHQRETLVKYLHVRFPSLDGARETPLYATPAAIELRQQELRQLKQEEIPANRKAIEEARALGDLRENFEYKAARQRHEYLNARLASLENDLSRVRPLDAAAIDPSQVRIGCQIELVGAADASRSLTILGPWESDPDDGIVSYDSEVGQQFLGKRTGDSVTVGGVEWEIHEIRARG